MKNLFCAGENTEAKRGIGVGDWGGIRKYTYNPIIEGGKACLCHSELLLRSLKDKSE